MRNVVGLISGAFLVVLGVILLSTGIFNFKSLGGFIMLMIYGILALGIGIYILFNLDKEDKIEQVKEEIGSVKKADQRVLVFSTTFYPHAGAAELALCDLVRSLPNVEFDVITTKFNKDTMGDECGIPNVNLYRVGYGYTFDKYLLPFMGARVGRKLRSEHSYMFQWALFASYGAMAALFSGRKKSLPLLITLADQKLATIPWYTRIVLKHLLGKADQVYAMDTYEAQAAISLSRRTALVKSIGSGDAFANQVRFAYSEFLRKRIDTQKKAKT